MRWDASLVLWTPVQFLRLWRMQGPSVFLLSYLCNLGMKRETGHVARSSWCLLCAEILFLIVTAIHVSQISQPRPWISFSTTSFTNFLNFSVLWKSAGLSVQELSWENAAQSSHLGLRHGAQPGMVSCTYAEGTGLRPSPLGFRELTQCSRCTQCCANCPVTCVSLCSITWGRLGGWTL